MHVLLKQINPVSIECFANFSVCIVKHKEIFSKALSMQYFFVQFLDNIVNADKCSCIW